jgi:hypothetical protein
MRHRLCAPSARLRPNTPGIKGICQPLVLPGVVEAFVAPDLSPIDLRRWLQLTYCLAQF